MEIVQTCQTAFRHGHFPLWLYPWLPQCSLPSTALAAARTTLPTSCDLQKNPRPSLATQTLAVSKYHCMKSLLCPAGHCPSPQERYNTCSCLTECWAGFPPMEPWEMPPWAGIFESSSDPRFCVKERRKSSWMGLGSDWEEGQGQKQARI
jgi:hypothetical protein